MNMQLAIIDLLRGMPRPLLRMLAGKPSSIDGNTLDLNMHMMSKLAARDRCLRSSFSTKADSS